jgi:hypothetical protein
MLCSLIYRSNKLSAHRRAGHSSCGINKRPSFIRFLFLLDQIDPFSVMENCCYSYFCPIWPLLSKKQAHRDEFTEGNRLDAHRFRSVRAERGWIHTHTHTHTPPFSSPPGYTLSSGVDECSAVNESLSNKTIYCNRIAQLFTIWLHELCWLS